jgi:chromosome segregation ATPase
MSETSTPGGEPPRQDRLTRMRALRAQSSSLVQQVQSDLSGARGRAESEARARMATEEGRSALAREHGALEARALDLERKVAERDALVQARDQDIARLRSSLDAAQSEGADLRGKLSAMEAAVEATSRASSELTAARGDLETSLASVRAQLQERDQQLAGAQELVAQRERDLREQRASFVERERTFARTVSGLEAQLKAGERALTDERGRAQRLLEETTAQAERLEREAADGVEREERLTRELGELRRQLEEATAAAQAERKAVEASKTWLGTERQRADRLQAERQQLVDQKAAAERRTAELEGQSRAHARLASAKEEENVGLLARFEELDRRRAAAEDELVSARRQAAESAEALDKLQKQHKELEAAFIEVTDAYEEFHKNIEQLGGRPRA